MEQKIDTRVIVKLTREEHEKTMFRIDTEENLFHMYFFEDMLPPKFNKALEGRTRSFWFADLLPLPHIGLDRKSVV